VESRGRLLRFGDVRRPGGGVVFPDGHHGPRGVGGTLRLPPKRASAQFTPVERALGADRIATAPQVQGWIVQRDAWLSSDVGLPPRRSAARSPSGIASAADRK